MLVKDLLYKSGASIGTIYLLVAFFFWVTQRYYIYLPTHTATAEARSELSDAYAEEWSTADGQYIGIKRLSPGAEVNYLVFHGNAGEALHRTYFTELLTHISLPGNVFVMEYPGYGRRDGSPSKKEFFSAADGALSVVETTNELPIIVVGESVGSGVAAYAAVRAEERLRALLFVTPFDSFGSVVWNTLPLFPTSLLLSENYENSTMLEGLRAPAYFVIADKDEVVGVKQGLKLFESYAGPKQKFVIPDVGHNDVPFSVDTDWVREFRWFLKRTQ